MRSGPSAAGRARPHLPQRHLPHRPHLSHLSPRSCSPAMPRAASYLLLLACACGLAARPAFGRGLFAAASADTAYPSPFPLFGAEKLTAEQVGDGNARAARDWSKPEGCAWSHHDVDVDRGPGSALSTGAHAPSWHQFGLLTTVCTPVHILPHAGCRAGGRVGAGQPRDRPPPRRRQLGRRCASKRSSFSRHEAPWQRTAAASSCCWPAPTHPAITRLPARLPPPQAW